MKKKFRLAPFFRVGFQSKKLYLGFGSIQKEITLPDLQKKYLKVLSKFIDPAELLSSKDPDQDIVDELIKKKYLNSQRFLRPK